MFSRKRKSFILIVLTIAISFVINGCSKKAPEGVVATVNKENITEEEYMDVYEIQANVLEIRLGEGVLDQVGEDGKAVKESLKEEVLTRLILEKIIMQDADKKDINVSEKEIDDRIEEMRESMGGEEQLNEYKEDLGMDDKYLSDFIKTDITLSKHKENFMKDLELKDKEVEQFFEDNKESLTLVKARQILVETEEKAKEILEKLKAGEDFQQLAMANSKDFDSVVKGGELGFFQRGKYPKEFDKVVFELEKGALSPVIQTEMGYHIVEVQDTKDTLESLKSEITHFAKENRYSDYIEKLQKNSKVKIYLEEENKK